MATARTRHTLHQLIAAAAPYDAVTGQALAWQGRVARWGVRGDVYAEHVHPDLRSRVRPLAEFGDDADSATVLRYSIWSAAADRALRVDRDRLCVWYHNITPAALLAGASPAVARLCDRGRRVLPSVVAASSVVIADSAFNAAELRIAGAGEVTVVPLLLDLPEYRSTRPPGSHVILTVGRVAPNKRIEDAIRAVAVLRTRGVQDARLVVVGSWDGFDPYHEALARFAAALGVADAVEFTGRVDDATRDRWYEEAGAYLCTSEHEGFCAPLVEALAYGLPVVARAAGAVPETIGDAGLVLPGHDAALVAEALARVLSDDEVRGVLGVNARRRLAELDPDRIEATARPAIEGVLR